MKKLLKQVVLNKRWKLDRLSSNGSGTECPLSKKPLNGFFYLCLYHIVIRQGPCAEYLRLTPSPFYVGEDWKEPADWYQGGLTAAFFNAKAWLAQARKQPKNDHHSTPLRYAMESG